MRNNKKSSRHKYLLGMAIFVAALSVPFVINELYKLNFGYETLWGAPDVLSFYGSFLSFAGSTVLGVVAYSQNKKLNEINRDLSKLQLEQYAPYIILESACEDSTHLYKNRLPDRSRSVLLGARKTPHLATPEIQDQYIKAKKK